MARVGLHHGGLPAGLSSCSAGNRPLSVIVSSEAWVQEGRRCGMWEGSVWKEHGTEGWGLEICQAWGLRSGGRKPSLESGNAARSPCFWPRAFRVCRRAGRGFMGLGPASGPLLAVAWVTSVKRSKAVLPPGVPPEVYFFLPPPLFQFLLTRAP